MLRLNSYDHVKYSCTVLEQQEDTITKPYYWETKVLNYIMDTFFFFKHGGKYIKLVLENFKVNTCRSKRLRNKCI